MMESFWTAAPSAATSKRQEEEGGGVAATGGRMAGVAVEAGEEGRDERRVDEWEGGGGG